MACAVAARSFSAGGGACCPFRVRLLDSAPIYVNTYARGGSSATLTGAEYFGIAKSHGATVFGLRLVLTTATTQVVDDWRLAPASYHDSVTMTALLEHHHSCWCWAMAPITSHQ